METILIYIHGEHSRESKPVEIPPQILISELIDLYRAQFSLPEGAEPIELFIEEEDEPRERHHHAGEAGIGKRSHIHCHRCRKVEVIVFYNGEDKLLNFPPSATTKRVLKKVLEAFKISEMDAGDYLLKLDDKTILQPGDHIGSFAVYPHCRVKLFLTSTRPVQG
jgi:hypothetical protein